MKNSLIISLLILSVGFSQRQERNEIITERHNNGLKKLVHVFVGTGINEILVGKYGFYDSGLKEFVEFYKNNKKDGKSLYWYGNGNQKSEFNYTDGKLNGLQTEWYENEQKKSEGTYKDGKIHGLRTEWYENGQKRYEGNYKEGGKDGLWSELYWNGNIKEKVRYGGGYKIEEIKHNSCKSR